MLSQLHQKYIHPWLKKWALKEPEYSLFDEATDRWTLPRWVHHFGVKALLQGVWPVFASRVFGFPLSLGTGISVAAMLEFKNWNKHPRNIVDIICDTTLQILIPVIWWNPWAIIPISLIYWMTYPYATP